MNAGLDIGRAQGIVTMGSLRYFFDPMPIVVCAAIYG
jgi:hypothetical protein